MVARLFSVRRVEIYDRFQFVSVCRLLRVFIVIAGSVNKVRRDEIRTYWAYWSTHARARGRIIMLMVRTRKQKQDCSRRQTRLD